LQASLQLSIFDLTLLTVVVLLLLFLILLLLFFFFFFFFFLNYLVVECVVCIAVKFLCLISLEGNTKGK
jgi:hypothetical protein